MVFTKKNRSSRSSGSSRSKAATLRGRGRRQRGGGGGVTTCGSSNTTSRTIRAAATWLFVIMCLSNQIVEVQSFLTSPSSSSALSSSCASFSPSSSTCCNTSSRRTASWSSGSSSSNVSSNDDNDNDDSKSPSPSSVSSLFSTSGGGTTSAVAAAVTTNNPLQHSSSRSSTLLSNDQLRLTLQRVAITVASTYYTWYAQRKYTNVMASSAFTLLCTMIFDKRFSNAIFCGTFAGMSSKAIIPSSNHALVLGTVTSLLYETMIQYRNQLVGLGGRLGVMAFLATWMVSSWAIGGFFSSFVTIASKTNLNSSVRIVETLLPMIFWHVVGCMATLILLRGETSTPFSTSSSSRGGEKGAARATLDPVQASALVGMAGALFLQDDAVAALAVYGGSFVGMSAPSRLVYGIVPGRTSQGGGGGGGGSSGTAATTAGVGAGRRIWTAFGGAAALAGLVHGITMDWGLWMGGWGGKAGACAFVGCVLYRGLVWSVKLVLKWLSGKEGCEEEEEGRGR